MVRNKSKLDKTMPAITQAQSKEEITAVQELWREYMNWTDKRLDAQTKNNAPTFDGFEEELAGLPGWYAPPAGRLSLATQDGLPAGCAALKGHSPVEAELKRLYVRPAFRGHGIGGLLVQTLVAEARQIGYRKIVLDTHITMKAAQAIYEANGFKVVAAPLDFPEALKPVVMFMECDLAD